MRMRRVCGLLLCLSLAVGSLAPAVPSYAMENEAVAEASVLAAAEASDDSSFPGEEETGAVDDAEVKETAAEAESSEASEEVSSESQETSEEEKETAPEEATEAATEAAGEDETSAEITDAPEEATTQDEATEAVSENASDEDLSGDEASLEDSEEVEVTVEEEKLVGKTDDFTIKSFKAEKSVVTIGRYKKVKIGVKAPKEICKYPLAVKWTCSDPEKLELIHNESDFWEKDEGCSYTEVYSGDKPGSFTLTATLFDFYDDSTDGIHGETEVVITVNVDCVDYENVIGYKDGKVITGWANTDPYGKLYSVGKVDMDSEWTVYFDPETGKLADGIYRTADGKLYYFEDNRLKKKASRVGNVLESINNNGLYCVDKYGEIKTGWQKIDAEKKEYYFDPETGVMVRGSWVPKGKSTVYVDSYGTLADGIIEINYKPFCFNKGAMVTGFVYVDKTCKKVSKEKAKFVMYFDPYAESKGEARQGMFTLKGKDYRASTGGSYKCADGTSAPRGCIPINTLFSSSSGYMFISDKSGALIKNKLVTYAGNKYYVDEYGNVVIGQTRVVNGKTCYFGEDGKMSVLGADGVGVEWNVFYEENGELLPAYVRSSDVKKPASGLAYYKDKECTKRLKNCFLYTDGGFGFDEDFLVVGEDGKVQPSPDAPASEVIAYLDGSGNPVTGIRKIGNNTYYFDTTGTIVPGSGVVVYKGKYYLLHPNHLGLVVTKPGFYFDHVGDSTTTQTGRWYYIKDSSGVLAKGKTTIDGKTYYFNDDSDDFNRGSLCYGGMRKSMGLNGSGSYRLGDYWFYIDGKMYYCHHNGQPLENTDASLGDKEAVARDCYLEEGKVQHFINADGKLYVVDKNGTGYTGLYKYDGKVCMVAHGMLRSSTVESSLITSGGKTYLIGKDNYGKSGWQKITQGTVYINYDNLATTGVPEGTYIYLDPNTLEAVTGWQTVPAPVFDSKGNITGTGAATKLYFNEKATKTLPKYAWVSNADLTVGGKAYHFGEDGTTVEESIHKSGMNERKYYSPRTHQYEKNVLRKVGKKWYYFGSDGVQSSDVSAIAFDGSAVTVTFNNDGSIKKFDAKNTTITIDGRVYAVGKGGVPVTGMFKLSGDDERSSFGGIGLFFDTDGYMPVDSDEYEIRKIGKSFYVVHAGVIQQGNKKYTVTNYDSLPLSNAQEIERSIAFNPSHFTNGMSVWAAADGTLKKGSYRENGVTYHTNAYGMAYEELSPFVKVGGAWYYTNASEVQSKSSTTYYLSPMGIDFTERRVNICWDKTGKITSMNYFVNGSDTGVAVSGVYYITINDMEYIVNLKSGKFVTGKKKVNMGGLNTTMIFDSVLAVASYIS